MGPTVASSRAAESRTDRVTACSTTSPLMLSPAPGPEEMRARVGFIPNRPQHEAGMRMEPPPSLACAIGTSPAATAAADPPLEPPADRSRSHGLWQGPKTSGSVVGWMPNSGVLVFPTTTRPAPFKRATSPESWSGTKRCVNRDPALVGTPAYRAPRSLSSKGTPAKGPRSSPPETVARASSNMVVTTAFSVGFKLSTRFMAASTITPADTSPSRTRAACAVASRLARSSTRLRRGGRLGFCPVVAGDESVYHGAGDANSWREQRQVVEAVPAGVLYLLGLAYLQLAAGVFGDKADHERVRERPGLAAEVTHLPHLDPDLLAHLAPYRLLDGFPRLHETRQGAVHPHRKMWRTRQQQLVAPPYEHDGRRAETRLVDHPAARAAPGHLVLHVDGPRRAAPAKLVGPVPLDDLPRPPRDPEKVLVRVPKTAQVPKHVPLRRPRIRVDVRRETPPPVQGPNVALERRHEVEILKRVHQRHGDATFGYEQLAVAEGEPQDGVLGGGQDG